METRDDETVLEAEIIDGGDRGSAPLPARDQGRAAAAACCAGSSPHPADRRPAAAREEGRAVAAA